MAGESFKFWTGYRNSLSCITDDHEYRVCVDAILNKVFDDVDTDLSDYPIARAIYYTIIEQAINSKDLSNKARESGARKGSKSTPESTTNKGSKSDKIRKEKKRVDKTRKEAESSTYVDDDSAISTPNSSRADGSALWVSAPAAAPQPNPYYASLHQQAPTPQPQPQQATRLEEFPTFE